MTHLFKVLEWCKAGLDGWDWRLVKTSRYTLDYYQQIFDSLSVNDHLYLSEVIWDFGHYR